MGSWVPGWSQSCGAEFSEAHNKTGSSDQAEGVIFVIFWLYLLIFFKYSQRETKQKDH